VQDESKKTQGQNITEQIFNDAEAMRNLVGFFDLALRVHMRTHPEQYRRADDTKDHD
jgi:hypothetical protein